MLVTGFMLASKLPKAPKQYKWHNSYVFIYPVNVTLNEDKYQRCYKLYYNKLHNFQSIMKDIFVHISVPTMPSKAILSSIITHLTYSKARTVNSNLIIDK